MYIYTNMRVKKIFNNISANIVTKKCTEQDILQDIYKK